MTTAAQTSVAGSVAQCDMLRYEVMAAFMDSGRTLERTSSLLLIAALLGAWPCTLSGWPAVTCFSMNLGLALMAKYYGWRVALDARLFRLLAQHPGQAAEFDGALGYCLGRHAKGTRSAASRWRGARRLLRIQAALVVLQGLAAAGTSMASVFFI